MNWRVTCLVHWRSGGNADLQMGRRSDTGEHVVVKFLRDFHLPYARKAFEREVRILAQSLPGMMPILFADTRGQRPYYVMPFLSGGSLTQYAGRLSDDQLLTVAYQVGRSLAALHGRHVSHGDIKPDNILVSADGQLQVADPLGNGIGCTVLFSQNHGGTPGYWAPEVQAGGPISQPGDVFSYGATLWQLLTGNKPQDGQRLDLVSQGYGRAPKIREIIALSCQRNPAARPNMQEVLRLVNGACWAEIEQSRQQQSALTAVCALGFLGLVAFALSQ